MSRNACVLGLVACGTALACTAMWVSGSAWLIFTVFLVVIFL